MTRREQKQESPSKKAWDQGHLGLSAPPTRASAAGSWQVGTFPVTQPDAAVDARGTRCASEGGIWTAPQMGPPALPLSAEPGRPDGLLSWVGRSEFIPAGGPQGLSIPCCRACGRLGPDGLLVLHIPVLAPPRAQGTRGTAEMGPCAYVAGPCGLRGIDWSKAQREALGRRERWGPSGEGAGDGVLDEVPSSLKTEGGKALGSREQHGRSLRKGSGSTCC